MDIFVVSESGCLLAEFAGDLCFKAFMVRTRDKTTKTLAAYLRFDFIWQITLVISIPKQACSFLSHKFLVLLN